MIYLDHAATTPVRREVLEAMWPYWTTHFANPASHHEPGHAAADGLKDARQRVAAILGGRAGEVTFLSGGTEGANAAIKGIAAAEPRGRHIIVSAVEHSAVLESARWLGEHGFEVTILEVDSHGRVDPGSLAAVIRPDTTLVSVQYANNEVGTIQPISELSAIARAHGAPLHTDAVQAAGWLPLDARDLGVAALSVSGHKLGTPRGIGALWVERRQRIEPIIHGGEQQPGRRSGTEDVAGAIGLATALERGHGDPQEMSARRDRFIARVLAEVPGAQLTGHPTERLPGNASFVLTSSARSGESMLIDLESRGVIASSGSACAVGSDEPSHVLIAMGFDRETAQTSIRFTFDDTITDEHLESAANALAAATTD